jgi:hypothetical protein
MKRTFVFISACFLAATSFGQKQSFDLASFIPPKAWKKELKANSHTSYTIVNKKKKTYCQIFIMLSTASKGGIKEDFESEWQILVANQYGVTDSARRTEPSTNEGWQLLAGIAPFTFNKGISTVMLTTFTGYNKAESIVALTNSEEYIPAIQQFLQSVEMKKPSTDIPITQTMITPGSNNKFTFTTTTYNDGWEATEQPDWVQVVKGTNRVLIHYPNKPADSYNSVALDGLKNAWDILVAPRYSSAANMEFKTTGGWESIEFGEADMVEKATGKTVYVVLFKKNYSNGKGKYVEFISPNKSSFEKEFGVYKSNMSGSGFEKMENMAFLNKFAVAASDLAGKWTTDFSGAIQYVNAYTGFDAGMDTHASNESYQFMSGNSYKWDLAVASGPVGNIKFQSVKSSGKFTMNGNWKISFSDIEGKPRSYDIYFSCIKGLRILWINNEPFAKQQ